jgi:predicted dehydrogenase
MNGRFVIENVYESITLYPRQSSETLVVRNSIMRGMQGFNDTFRNRIERFIEQLKQNVAPEEIEGSGLEALAAQEVIEAAITSQQSGGNAVDVPNHAN